MNRNVIALAHNLAVFLISASPVGCSLNPVGEGRETPGKTQSEVVSVGCVSALSFC